MRHAPWLALLAVWAATGCNCGEDRTRSDAAIAVSDAGAGDAGTPDAGEPDASLLDDAGAQDAGACPFAADATFAATLRFTADNQRAVYLNGHKVEDDPGLGWGQVSTLGVALNRRPAVANVLAVRGTNTSSQAGPDRGILVDLSWDPPDGGSPLPDGGKAGVVSDGLWRVSTSAGQDGGLDWTLHDYDDSRWPPAVDEGPNGMSPWGLLLGPSAARWIWSYDSGPVSNKPDLEDAFFRRVFFVTWDGLVSDAPGPCNP